MNSLKFLFFLVSYLLFSTQTIAQEKSIIIETSNDTLLFGNYIVLSITLHNTDATLDDFTFDDFKIICGPSLTNTYQNINGVESKNKRYTYHLEAKKEGVFKIPAIEIEDNNEPLISNDLSITILPNPDGIITTPQRKERPSSFQYQWTLPQPPTPSTPKNIDPLKKKRKKI